METKQNTGVLFANAKKNENENAPVMDILDTFSNFNNEIKKLEDSIKKIEEQRLSWCYSNKESIKAFLPKHNKIYKINNITQAIDEYHHDKINIDEDYFFKATDVRFVPKRDFDRRWAVYPTIKGDILDCNLRKIDISVFSDRVSINLLEEVTNDISGLSNKFTKIYIMIDKNTGFYKIGRSITPIKREKTLQSEKPTIEMLFYFDGRVKDEKTLHDKYKDKRVRGEWFNLSGTDINTIKEYFNP